MSALLPFLPSIISGITSIGSSMLNRRGSDETPVQGQQRELIDQILASLKGDGPFSDLFQADDAAFQKSYVDPAKQMFRDQIAPQIQAAYTGGKYGQQRSTGTGIQDSLARAGVDLDQMLNQQYAQFQQQGQGRQMDAINRILSQGRGGSPGEQSYGDAALEGFSGFLSSSSAPQGIETILDQFRNKPGEDQSESIMDTFRSPRKGFEREPQVYNPYTGVQQ